MRKIGNVDGWAGMFFLTKFAENAVILVLLTLIPSLRRFTGVERTTHENILCAVAPYNCCNYWTPLHNVSAVFVVECQHRTKDRKYYLVTKAIVATF